MSAARFDDVVHAPNRLRICAALDAVQVAEFATIRDAIGVSDSVLSKHVAVLEDAGYLAVSKSPRGGRTYTSLSLTGAGRSAYHRHLAALREIVATEGRL